MKLVTYNVNGIKARLPRLLEYLAEQQPDIVCLQELKSSDDTFPIAEIGEAGYRALWHGQKGFNGVAVLSRGEAPVERQRGLTGEPEDEHSRYLECQVGEWTVASIYLPNGNPVGSDKYPYKLGFMDRLIAHAGRLLVEEEPLVLAGDYNVIPEAQDVADPQNWTADALFLPDTRQRFRALLNLGLTEAMRATTDAAGVYSFWDYQAGAWQKNRGIRIDHLLLSAQAADRLTDCVIDRDLRGLEKPSDHVPVRVELA